LKIRFGSILLTGFPDRQDPLRGYQSLLNELTCCFCSTKNWKPKFLFLAGRKWLVISLAGRLEKPAGNNEYKHPHEWLVQYFKC
jgi:hypothetical protein